MEQRRSWYDLIPHPVVMLFGIIVLAAVMTHVLPAGIYERIAVDGRDRVVPGSYHLVESSPVGLFALFKAFIAGFKTAGDIIFVVLSSGIMFGVLDKTGAIENLIGRTIHRLGLKRRYTIVFALTYLFGLLGVVIGYENNIAMVPIAAVVALALGGDLVLAAGLSVGAITVGFGLSPINPYTVGTGHKIAEMTIFSGAVLRTALCFCGLTALAFYNVRYFKKITADPSKSLSKGLDTTGFALSKPLAEYQVTTRQWMVLSLFVLGIAWMVFGVLQHEWKWGFTEISAIFLMITIAVGVAGGLSPTVLSETVLKSVGVVAPGAFMVGYATSIKEVLELGQINDTISYQLSLLLTDLPTTLSAIGMSASQCLINLFIPSGSGQALATLPIMIPLGEVLGLTRQTTILAFQIGDGVTNLFNPALGGLIAMLSLCRVPFDRWLRFILPLTGLLLIVAWLFLVGAVWFGYGPV